MNNDKTNGVMAWLEGLEEAGQRGDATCAPSAVRFVDDPVSAGSHSDPLELAIMMRASIDTAWSVAGQDGAQCRYRSKGIYVWYWPADGKDSAWPLYVGKSQRGRSCFGARTASHLRNAASGKDFIYSEVGSRQSRCLKARHKAGIYNFDPRMHCDAMLSQFSSMRLLTLPMENALAAELAGSAEGLLLAAAAEIHQERLCNPDPKRVEDCLMNSPGRASRVNNPEDARKAAQLLRGWMAF